MKAVFFEKPGGLEVLQYGEFTTPKAQKGEALVRVRAAGLNRLDIWLREDKENARNIPVPHISGMENDKRPIGKAAARKFAEVFGTDFRRFL